jgi:hypothetical protein
VDRLTDRARPPGRATRVEEKTDVHKWVTRGAASAAALAATAVVVTGWTGPAWAHVEVSADKPQAGAENVTVTFNGEAESTSAGIKSERVVLPKGITADQVRLGKAPSGWKFTPASDGFTVGGTPLKVGQDARFSVVVAKLPAGATELVFKTIETYGDGEVQRWIEIPQAGQPEPDNPAPVLKVRPAAQPAATTAAPTTATPATSAPAASAQPSLTPSAVADPDPGSRTGLWIAIIAVVVVAAAAAVAFAIRRRRAT